jgi:hypothetical protein
MKTNNVTIPSKKVLISLICDITDGVNTIEDFASHFGFSPKQAKQVFGQVYQLRQLANSNVQIID